MIDSIFYWIGLITVILIAGSGLLLSLFLFYMAVLQSRFNIIFFRKSQRRLSIASWYSTRMLTDEGEFRADDFPINERPFYLSYRIGKRRLFIMLGSHTHRIGPIQGTHPEESKNV